MATKRPFGVQVQVVGVFVFVFALIFGFVTHCSYWHHSFCDNSILSTQVTTIFYVLLGLGPFLYIEGSAVRRINAEGRRTNKKSRTMNILFFTGTGILLLVVGGLGIGSLFNYMLPVSIVSDPGERALWWFATVMIGLGLISPYAFVKGMYWMMGIKDETLV